MRGSCFHPSGLFFSVSYCQRPSLDFLGPFSSHYTQGKNNNNKARAFMEIRKPFFVCACFSPRVASLCFHIVSHSVSDSLCHSEHRTMAAWTAVARQAANMARLSSPKSACSAQAASLVHRRGLAVGGGNLLTL